MRVTSTYAEGVNELPESLERKLLLCRTMLKERSKKLSTWVWFAAITTLVALSHYYVLKLNFSEPIQTTKSKDATKTLTVHSLKSDESMNIFSYMTASKLLGKNKLGHFRNMSIEEMEKQVLATIPALMKKNARRILRPVLHLSIKHQVDPIWVLSVIWTESHFRHRARSHVGAHGLMQLMPGTYKYLKKSMKKKGIKLLAYEGRKKLAKMAPHYNLSSQVKVLKSKLVNLELGIYYLKYLQKMFKSPKLATIAYNMGPGWTLKRMRNKGPLGVRNKYLNKVNRAYRILSNPFKDA